MSNEYHTEIENMNETLRNIIKVWIIDNYEPSLSLIAKKIGINEISFSRFLKGQKDITLEQVNDVLDFVMREEFKKNNREYIKSLQFNSESVREALNEWADSLYNPNLKKVSELIGINYSMLIQFKSNRTNLGRENLNKVYCFLKEQV